MYLSNESFCMIYKALVRSQLEYAATVWCPYRKEDIVKIEKVQMRATKLLHSIKKLPYKARLRVLKLPSMKYRRIRGDMIEIYKIINHKYDINTTLALRLNSDYITRGNKHKLQQYHCKYDLRKYFFTNRIIGIWNSLPSHVVDVPSIDAFKNSLDKFWCMQDIVYDFEEELSGTGNRSFE